MHDRVRDVDFCVPYAGPLVTGEGHAPSGGAEFQLVALARHLAARGHRIGLRVDAGGAALPGHVDGVAVVARRPRGTRVPILRALVFHASTVLGLMRDPARVLVQRNAGSYTGLVALAARLRRRRFVYSSANVIDFDFARLERRGLSVRLFHLGIRLASEIVVQTDEQRRLCRERFGREAVLIKSIAEPADRREAAAEAFLWIGRVVDYKQPLAFVELARARPEARFRMVAVRTAAQDEALAEELERQAATVPNLELLPARSRSELAPLIERAVALVNTARYEGMPNVYLEGWSRGVPALALAHDPDGVIEREGLGAFAGGSQERLAELAAEMWRERDQQAELAERCRAYVQREHSLERAGDRWAAVLGLARPA